MSFENGVDIFVLEPQDQIYSECDQLIIEANNNIIEVLHLPAEAFIEMQVLENQIGLIEIEKDQTIQVTTQIDQAQAIVTEEQAPFVINTFVQGLPGPFSKQLGLFLMWSNAYPSFFKHFNYDQDGNLQSIDLWSDNSMSLKIFNKAFNYDSGILTSIVVTDIQSGLTETKTFNYENNVLVSQDVVQT